MNPRERRILFISCFGHFLSHFNMLVFPAVLLPLTARLNMDMSQVLGLSFWMYLLFGLTALPWGMLADRWGGKSLMALFFLGAGLSGLAAAAWIDSPAGLSLALAGVGLFSGISHPIGLGMISKGVSRMSMALGYNGMFGNLGLATAPLLTGIVNWLWGPGAVYLVLGGLNLLGVVLMTTFPLTEPPQQEQWGSKEDNGLLGAFLILLAVVMMGGLAYRGATVIMPAYFELKNQLIFQKLSGLWPEALSSNLVATTTISFIYLVGMLGQYTGGRVAERFEPRFSYLLFHAVIIPAAFLMAVASDIPLVSLALFYFFFMLGAQPIENTLVARITPQRLHHSAYGTKFVLTFGVGALAVKMMGGIQRVWGIETAFPSLGIISLALVGFVVLLISHTNQGKKFESI
ncbi:MAG: MFS transporter [Deltaproteobacteria bacterium]|nr:MFS transporter [Deltaproteobacteria bacterium]